MKKAVIFDLDGVIISTDNYHYLAWKKLADEEGLYFSREINERLRGVSRIESFKIILEYTEKKYSSEKMERLIFRKNEFYKAFINNLTEADIFPGIIQLLSDLKKENIKCAIGSSSRNAKMILERINLLDSFDAVSNGTMIKNSKPDPEVFFVAAKLLGEDASDCVVIEDADSGIEAAISAGMKAVAVGPAALSGKADISVKNINEIDYKQILE